MFLRTQYIMQARALLNRILANMVDATPARVLDVDSKIWLYTDGPLPSIDSVVGDFTEADFSGYARVTLATILGPINLPGGEGVHKECDFVADDADPITPQSAKGMLIVDTDNVTLLGAEQFVTPVPFTVPGDALSYDLILAPRSSMGGEASAA